MTPDTPAQAGSTSLRDSFLDYWANVRPAFNTYVTENVGSEVSWDKATYDVGIDAALNALRQAIAQAHRMPGGVLAGEVATSITDGTVAILSALVWGQPDGGLEERLQAALDAIEVVFSADGESLIGLCSWWTTIAAGPGAMYPAINAIGESLAAMVKVSGIAWPLPQQLATGDAGVNQALTKVAATMTAVLYMINLERMRLSTKVSDVLAVARQHVEVDQAYMGLVYQGTGYVGLKRQVLDGLVGTVSGIDPSERLFRVDVPVDRLIQALERVQAEAIVPVELEAIHGFCGPASASEPPSGLSEFMHIVDIREARARSTRGDA